MNYLKGYLKGLFEGELMNYLKRSYLKGSYSKVNYMINYLRMIYFKVIKDDLLHNEESFTS